MASEKGGEGDSGFAIRVILSVLELSLKLKKSE